MLVAASGGIDSSTLLFLLSKIGKNMGFSIAVAHVNHQLRGEESTGDEVFVRGLAESLGAPCYVLKADVRGYARENGLSVQHAGRDLRYRYFEETADAHGCDRIAIAHNIDDQVETFLLRVIKGSGLSGLASIPIRRGRIIRPLLRSFRSQIVEYAQSHAIAYREDSSNLSDKYERNFIRRRIAPLLDQLNPRFKEKVLFLLTDITGVNAVLDADVAGFLEKEARREGQGFRVGVAALKNIEPEVRFRVVSRLLGALSPRFVALREHARLVEKSLFSPRPNNEVTLPGGMKVNREYQDLIFTKKEAEIPLPVEAFPVGPGRQDLPCFGLSLDVSVSDEKPESFPADRLIAFFDAERISTLSLRTFRPGDRFVPLGMAHSVKVKDYFISRKTPREKRRKTPFLLSDGEIIWLVGERINDLYKVTASTTKVLKVAARVTSPLSID